MKGVIFTYVSGTPTTVTMIDHIQKVLNDSEFDPNLNSIIVLGESTHIPGVPKNKIDTIRRVLDGYAQQRKGRNCAIVAPTKRLVAFMELTLEMINPVIFNFRIFQNVDDAFNWLENTVQHQA
jgi:hypothetical protein